MSLRMSALGQKRTSGLHVGQSPSAPVTGHPSAPHEGRFGPSAVAPTTRIGRVLIQVATLSTTLTFCQRLFSLQIRTTIGSPSRWQGEAGKQTSIDRKPARLLQTRRSC